MLCVYGVFFGLACLCAVFIWTLCTIVNTSQHNREQWQKDFCARLHNVQNSMSLREFARQLDISPSTLLTYLTVPGRVPSADLCVRICAQYNLSVLWLLTGEGPKLAKDLHPPTSPDISDDDDESQTEIKEIVDLVYATIRRGDMQTIGYIKGYLMATEDVKREEESEKETKTKTGKKRAQL